MLDNAVKDRGSPFRIPVLFVVISQILMEELLFLENQIRKIILVQYHSDIRSDKIDKLKTNQNAAMLFYDKEEKIQVRLKVECIVNHENEITKESWSKTQTY